jgi:hypothetical protein
VLRLYAGADGEPEDVGDTVKELGGIVHLGAVGQARHDVADAGQVLSGQKRADDAVVTLRKIRVGGGRMNEA